MHQYVFRFYRVAANLIRSLPEWVHPVMSFVTLLGQSPIMIGVGVAVAVIGYLKGLERLVVAVCLGYVAFGIDTLIKHSVHRARPDTLYAHNMHIKSYSFPSGHAFGSTFFLGLVTYLAFQHLPQPWNVLSATALVFLIFLIGVSRVYLGAHFPSDVVAGWLFGTLCLVLVIKLTKI